MYAFTLALHSIVRWVVLVLGIVALSQVVGGWMRGRTWAKIDRQLGLFFTISIDIQLLLGIVLMFTSPLMQAAFNNMGAVSGSPEMRFFVMEHVPLMILAFLAAHVTSVLVRRAEVDSQRYRRAAIGYGLVLLAILVAMPWARPVFPGLS